MTSIDYDDAEVLCDVSGAKAATGTASVDNACSLVVGDDDVTVSGATAATGDYIVAPLNELATIQTFNLTCDASTQAMEAHCYKIWSHLAPKKVPNPCPKNDTL